MVLGDINISLLKLTNHHKEKLKFHTKTDLHGIRYLLLPIPDAYFSIEETKDRIKRYFLDIFDPAVSEKWLIKRVLEKTIKKILEQEEIKTQGLKKEVLHKI